MYTGRLTDNAKVKNVKGDKQVTEFTLVINRRYKNAAGEKQQKSLFINCSYWRNAGIAEYLTKGAIITVSGWLGADAWIDNEGKPQAAITLSVDNIELYEGKRHDISGAVNGTGAKGRGKRKDKAIADVGVMVAEPADDDLPF
ncbi:single-strand DNA-binding protein [Mucilaginibacter yixingensis]|uniref:Single-stranded DNA-binding protein n=1 Tax=Mucilaginibacter yixingensis TaxID=1295612 RepID=A0A2T5J5W9_9SPHI|nr:single-stranded DNA-binding protein [Mucilaginibacter yixingensis]PTQ93945.1 single-strand DNA-binding protein [Mucilaginibacter yixingensis]